jgi:uncharacterized protein
LGSILRGKPEDVIDSDKLSKLTKQINVGVRMCEQSCDFYRVCGGGAPANKLAEHGTFAATETSYCRNSVKSIASLVADCLIHDLSSLPM